MLTYKQSDITTASEDIVVNAANGIGWMGGFHSRAWYWKNRYYSCGNNADTGLVGEGKDRAEASA